MSGTVWVEIVTPIVALVVLGTWLAMVYWADAHPAIKAHRAAPEPESSETALLAGESKQALTQDAAFTESESLPVSAAAAAAAADAGEHDRELVPSPPRSRVA